VSMLQAVAMDSSNHHSYRNALHFCAILSRPL
jgi:hypothetical protein